MATAQSADSTGSAPAAGSAAQSPLLSDLLKAHGAHTDKVRVEVPVRLVGTAVGVKEGGLLDFPMHSIEIECLPHQIPEHLDIDITALTIGHSIHVGEIPVAPGIRLLADPRASVVSVLGKAREEAPAAE